MKDAEIPIALRVHLSPSDESLATAITQGRRGPKKDAGVTSRRIDSRISEWDLQHMGSRTEVAVAKVTNGAVNTAFSLGGDDHTGDVLLPTGHWVEVKLHRGRGWDFALTTDDAFDFNSSFGVLVWPIDGTEDFDVRGVVSRKTFIDKNHLADYGYGPRCALRWDLFTPMDAFIRWIEGRCSG